jgi:hypothetical protein
MLSAPHVSHQNLIATPSRRALGLRDCADDIPAMSPVR